MKSNGKSTTPIIAAHAKKNNGNKPAPPSQEKGNSAKRVPRASSRTIDKVKCQVLERISDGILALDAEMNLIYVNERAGKILGHEPQDLAGKNFLEVFPDLMGRPFVDACQRALTTQTVVPFEGYFAPSNTWFEARVYPSDEGVSVLLRQSIHPLENTRSASYNIYDVSQFPEQNPNPVMRFTRDGELLYANSASSTLLDSWKGQNRYNLPIQLHELMLVVSQTGSNTEMELENGGKIYSCLLVPVRESGYVNLYFSDVTERKQAEGSVNALIHQTITGITRSDVNGNFLFVNQAFCEMLGYSESELLGKATWEVNHPDDVAKNKRLFEKMITEGEPYQLEKRVVRHNGSILWVTVGAAPLRDASGQIYAAVSVVVDITRRKRAEEALLDSARRTLYLASLSDAIRSLGTISQIEAEAVRILGIHLKASRVMYATIGPDGTATVKSNYADGVAALSGTFDISKYIPHDRWTKLRAGRTVTISEADRVHRSSDSPEAGDEPASIHTQVVVPLLREGELVAVLFVQQSQKRDWKNEEIHIMEETAERMQVAIERARAEQELRESEKRFRILSNTVPSMVWSTAPDGTVQYLNEYWYSYTGLTAEQSIANWKSTLHPDDYERVLNAWDHSLATGDDYSLELRYRRYDGEYRWFQSRATPTRDENGNITAWYGVGTDIHDRAEKQEALQKIINSTPFMLTRCSRDLRYRFVSNAYAEMLGRTPEQVAGKPIVEIMGKKGFETILPYVEQVLQGKRVEYETEISFENVGVPALHVVYTPDYDERGEVVGWIASITDVTERKQMEEEIEGSNQRLNEILTSIQDDFYVLDRDWKFVYANRLFTAKAGKEPEDFIGNNIWEMFPKHVGTNFEENFRAAMEKRETRRFEVGGKYANAWYQMAAFPSAEGITVLGTNITERKRAEEQLRELSQRLTYHVDNSPLAVIEWGPDMRLSRWSGMAERIFGWKAEEVLGKRIEDFPWVYKEDIQQVSDVSTDLQTGNDIHRFSMNRNYRKDGSVAYCEWYNSSLIDESGELRSILSLVLDVTERKQGERALVEYARQQSALYKLVDQLHRADNLEDVFEASLDAIISALQCDRASILLFDEMKKMHFVAWRGLSDEYRKATDEHSPWKFGEENPKPIWYDDVPTSDLNDSLKAVIAREGIGSLAFIPLVYQEQLIGKFMVYYNTPHVFTESDINLSLTIGRQLASSVDRKRAEERLRASEDRLQLAVSAGKIGIWDMDLVRLSRAWSKEGKAIYGLAEDELLDFERQLELTHPEDRAYVDRTVRAFRDEGTTKQLELEHRIVHPDGSLHWVQVQGEAIYEEGPLPVRLIGTIVDITERKRAEEALRQSEERFAQFMQYLPGLAWIKDIHGRYVYANAAAEQAFGVSREELYGKTDDEVFTPEIAAQFKKNDEYALQEAKGLQVVETLKQDDGVLHYSLVTKFPIPGEDGTPALIGGTAFDITEQRQTEYALRESEQRYRAIVNQATAGIVRKDARGKLLFVNDAFCEMLGYSASELRDKTIWQFTSEEDLEQSQKLFNYLMAEGIPFQQEKRLIRSDGSILWVAVSVSPVLDVTGRPESSVSVYVDITERKQAEGRLALLAKVSDQTRRLEDPIELMASVADAIGRHFQVKRCLFNEIDIETDREVVHRDYHDGVESVAGTHKLTDYSSVTTAEMIAGKTVVNSDSKIDPRTAADYERSYVPNGERAYVAIPLLRKESWVASLWISDDKPRQWNEEDVKLLQTVAERAWTTTEKLRINNALRDSEERLRKLNIELEERVQRRTSELQAMNEWLRESEATSQLILESMPDAILIADKEGRIVYGNTQVEHLFGYSKQEVIGQPVEVLIPQRFHADHAGYRSDYSQQPHRHYMGLGRDLFGQRKDESEFPVDVMLSPISNNTNWDVMVTIRDNTEQKQAQQALRANEEKLRKLFQVLPVGISFLDYQGQITEMNSALTDILGLSKNELLEGKFRNRHYIRSDGSPMPPAEFASVRAREEQRTIYNVETGIIKENGETIWTSVNASPVDIAEVDVVIATIDITERKKAEEALHKHRERLRVLSRRLVEVQEEERRAIARELHDRVGQNLAALNLNLNILRSQLTNTALLEVGQRLSDSVNLVNQILTITRNVMGDLRSDVLDDYGLEAALREYGEQFAVRTGIQVAFDKSAKPIPRMDPSIEMTLLRIAQEALTNVSKHAQAKQATVSVSHDNEAVYMSIHDDGIGILSWQRANQPGSHGLRIIRERAEAFGGSLQVQSTYKKGTRIDVKIPLGSLSQPKVSREKRS